MNPLLSLIPEFENYLEQFSNIMIQDLAYFISTESKNLNLAYFHFERDFDDYVVVLISYDKYGKVITDCVTLPIKDRSKGLYELDNFVEIYPSDIIDKEVEIYENYISTYGEDKKREYWDLEGEYIEYKRDVFDKWFNNCWQSATQKTSIYVIAYLFMHESYDIGLNLNTMKYEKVPNLVEESNSIETKKPWWKFWR